jgi:hypothetical protein
MYGNNKFRNQLAPDTTLLGFISKSLSSIECRVILSRFPSPVLVPFRVSRLGEFSPIRRLFTLGSFQKMAEAAHIFGLLYSTVKVMPLF